MAAMLAFVNDDWSAGGETEVYFPARELTASQVEYFLTPNAAASKQFIDNFAGAGPPDEDVSMRAAIGWNQNNNLTLVCELLSGPAMYGSEYKGCDILIDETGNATSAVNFW